MRTYPVGKLFSSQMIAFDKICNLIWFEVLSSVYLVGYENILHNYYGTIADSATQPYPWEGS